MIIFRRMTFFERLLRFIWKPYAKRKDALLYDAIEKVVKHESIGVIVKEK